MQHHSSQHPCLLNRRIPLWWQGYQAWHWWCMLHSPNWCYSISVHWCWCLGTQPLANPRMSSASRLFMVPSPLSRALMVGFLCSLMKFMALILSSLSLALNQLTSFFIRFSDKRAVVLWYGDAPHLLPCQTQVLLNLYPPSPSQTQQLLIATSWDLGRGGCELWAAPFPAGLPSAPWVPISSLLTS